jgi:hypothetical protein
VGTPSVADTRHRSLSVAPVVAAVAVPAQPPTSQPRRNEDTKDFTKPSQDCPQITQMDADEWSQRHPGSSQPRRRQGTKGSRRHRNRGGFEAPISRSASWSGEGSAAARQEMGAPTRPRSLKRVEEAPGHGADVVEELQGGCCLIAMHGVGKAEETRVCSAGLLGRPRPGVDIVGAGFQPAPSVTHRQVSRFREKVWRSGRGELSTGLLGRLWRPSVDIVGAGFQPAPSVTHRQVSRFREKVWRSGRGELSTGLLGRLWRPSVDIVGAGFQPAPSVTHRQASRIREKVWRSGRGELSTGLLGRLWRPSVAPSAWSLGGRLEGCDPADGASAASLVAGTGDCIALPVGARHVIVRGAPRGREVDPAQLRARHPAAGALCAGPDAAPVADPVSVPVAAAAPAPAPVQVPV